MTNKEYKKFLIKVDEMMKYYNAYVIEDNKIFIEYKLEGNRLKNTVIHLHKDKPVKRLNDLVFAYIEFENGEKASIIFNNVCAYTGKLTIYNTMDNLYWELDSILEICNEEVKEWDIEETENKKTASATILNHGLYYNLDNGYSSYKEIDETTIEGLKYGFLDIYEIIDIDWIIEENEFSNEVCIDSWTIKELSKEDIIELDF